MEQGGLLPLTALDRTLFSWDRYSRAPWTFVVQLRSTVDIELERLRAAMWDAMRIHPLMGARMVRRNDRWMWELDDRSGTDPLSEVICADDEALVAFRDEFTSAKVDPTAGPSWRACVIRHPDGDQLLCSVGHTAVDGVSVVRFLRTLTALYRGDLGTAAAATEHRDALEAARDFDTLFGRDQESRARAKAQAKEAAPPFRQALGRMLRPTKPAKSGGRRDSRIPVAVLTRTLSAEQTAAIGDLRVNGSTVTDVLVGALHLAIDRWNTSRGKASRSVNVTMPRNVRPAAWSSEICSNIWTGTGVVTDPAQRDGLAATIAAVSEQTRAARQVDHGANLHEVLQSAARTPERVLHLIQVLSRGQESGVLSSLGAMTSQELSFGPHDRVEVWFVPVAGDPLAGVALGAVTVDDQLHLGMRYPARQFNRDAAEEFFDHYVAVLEP